MIGERIEQLRKARGLTLAELGKKIGVAASTVQKWETGQIQNIRINKVPVIAKALGVTIEYLMGFTDDPQARLIPDEAGSPELLEVVRIYKGLDLRQKHRLLEYAWLLEEGKQ